MSARFVFVYLVICLASQVLGRWAAKTLGLPLLTGFLITGIIAGPHSLKMLSEHDVEELDFVFDICLGYIALAAGGEMYLAEIKPQLMAIAKISLTQMLSFFSIGVLAVYFFAPATDFMKDMSSSEKVALSFVTAVIMSARSPSSAIAIINELGAKGPFVQTSLGVTMVSDVLVIIGFAITNDVAGTIFNNESLSGEFVSVLMGDIFMSFLIGALVNKLLEIVLRRDGSRLEAFVKRRLPAVHREVWMPYLRGRGDLFRGLALLGIGYGVFAGADALKTNAEIHLETLLILMTAGFLLINRTAPDGMDYRHALHMALNAVGDPTLVAFFTVVGLGLNISIIFDVIGVAVFFFVARAVALFVGAYFGGVWAHAPKQHNRLSFLTYITQAGVALALTEEVKTDYPNFGEKYATAIVATLVIGQLVGPIGYKWAVERVGEAGVTKDLASPQASHVGALPLTVWWWQPRGPGGGGPNGEDDDGAGGSYHHSDDEAISEGTQTANGALRASDVAGDHHLNGHLPQALTPRTRRRAEANI